MTGALPSLFRRRPARPGSPTTGQDSGGPFRALGLEPRLDLTDDEVRAAWRRIAAATHPDRADGGDPDRFAAAAAAYTALRTRFGRGEALADVRAGPSSGSAGPVPAVIRPRPSALLRAAGRLAFRVRRGRPSRLALRVLAAVSASAAAAAVAGAQPATPALITGAVTWLVLTAHHDLAPPAGN
jgi:curved DNA-binding protein CbpA